jgi:hypothetical protein
MLGVVNDHRLFGTSRHEDLDRVVTEGDFEPHCVQNRDTPQSVRPWFSRNVKLAFAKLSTLRRGRWYADD